MNEVPGIRVGRPALVWGRGGSGAGRGTGGSTAVWLGAGLDDLGLSPLLISWTGSGLAVVEAPLSPLPETRADRIGGPEGA